MSQERRVVCRMSWRQTFQVNRSESSSSPLPTPCGKVHVGNYTAGFLTRIKEERGAARISVYKQASCHQAAEISVGRNRPVPASPHPVSANPTFLFLFSFF